ncbi:hypothetical protein [Nonomuraea jabiensis]|uniref:hypothetical protein n=1 Tax=Nonomuraea jabiensis TaxID=882448 RepID=UPI003D710D63
MNSAPEPMPLRSLAEIRRVLARLFIPAANAIEHVLAWSAFRRLHQARARPPARTW